MNTENELHFETYRCLQNTIDTRVQDDRGNPDINNHGVKYTDIKPEVPIRYNSGYDTVSGRSDLVVSTQSNEYFLCMELKRPRGDSGDLVQEHNKKTSVFSPDVVGQVMEYANIFDSDYVSTFNGDRLLLLENRGYPQYLEQPTWCIFSENEDVLDLSVLPQLLYDLSLVESGDMSWGDSELSFITLREIQEDLGWG